MKKKISVAMMMLFVATLSMAFNPIANAHTEENPFVTDLIAGQHTDVGDVSVWNDGEYLYVKYETTDGWYLTETHLHIAASLVDIPQTKTGNPIPGQFEYSMEHDPPVTEYTYPPIPLEWATCTDVYIAAHAVVQRIDTICIDFEEYEEYDEVSTVSTQVGDVSFYMVSSDPLVGLSIGDTGNLTAVPDTYPTVAEGDTGSGPPDYTGIVAFTVQYPGNPYRDDWVKDDGGTGAGGKLLTDPLDLSRTNLLQHAFSQYLAIAINVSAIEGFQGLSLAGVDLDWREIWQFQYFNADDVLIHENIIGPAADNSGDGVAFLIPYSNPEISNVAIWGSMNLGDRERIGYAIDNICICSIVQEETAWGDGFDFPGKNWAMYFTYHVQPVVWPQSGTATIAFEDLPIGGGNDYDYNDFIADVSVVGNYTPAGLTKMKFVFDAQARGAAYHHDFHMLIPADTLGSTGEYTIEYYETDGSFLSSTSGAYDNTTDLDLTIFEDTWNALPPNPSQSWSGNTFDGSGLQAGRKTIVIFEFTTPFAFDLTTYSPEYVGVHGDNLFFDPYLYVRNTAEEIHIADARLIVVPTDWEWPQEKAAIWTVYPYNTVTGQGVTAGNPPTFTTYWYTETPTGNKWTP